MSKSVHTPAHRGAPRPFRVTPASVVRSHVADVKSGRAKLSATVLVTSGLTVGALMAAPAANAATPEATAHTAAHTAPAQSAQAGFHVVKAPTLEMSPLGEVQHQTQLRLEADQLEREIAANRARAAARAARAARAAAEAKAREAAREAERRAAAARARAYAASHSGKVAKALETVKSEMGKPYVWGAAGPDAFDCSGLMQYSFARAGIFLPRTADAQSHAVRSIPSSQLQPGDLIFFGSGHVYHVGMFLRWEGGQAIMLHAPHPGASVREEAAWGSDWHAGTLR